MTEHTEIMLQVTNVKEVTKSDSPSTEETYYHTKFKATNTDKVTWFKAKTTEKIAEPEDTFSLRDMVTQANLSDIVKNDVEEEME